jgi:DNA gyrase inhibitor GyrI
MGEIMSLGVRDFTLEDQEIFPGEDYAVETGRAAFSNGAGIRLAVVRYMTLWKRTVDGWRIHRDLSAPVSIGAAPAAPATFRVRESQPFHALLLPMTGPYERTGAALGRLMVALVEQELEPTGPAFGRYYDDEDETPPASRRFEVGFPVAAGTKASPPLEVREIDDGPVVWAVVGGPHEGTDRPWPELEEWLPANGYAENGPAMETWMDGPKTEMRMPVRRID